MYRPLGDQILAVGLDQGGEGKAVEGAVRHDQDAFGIADRIGGRCNQQLEQLLRRASQCTEERRLGIAPLQDQATKGVAIVSVWTSTVSDSRRATKR